MRSVYEPTRCNPQCAQVQHVHLLIRYFIYVTANVTIKCHTFIVLRRLNAHEVYHGVHGRTRPTGKQLAKGSLSKFDVWITLTIHVGYILKLYNQMPVSIPNIYIYMYIYTRIPPIFWYVGNTLISYSMYSSG